MCVLLEYIISASEIYARIVLVGYWSYLRGYCHFEPLPTSVGRTLGIAKKFSFYALQIMEDLPHHMIKSFISDKSWVGLKLNEFKGIG